LNTGVEPTETADLAKAENARRPTGKQVLSAGRKSTAATGRQKAISKSMLYFSPSPSSATVPETVATTFTNQPIKQASPKPSANPGEKESRGELCHREKETAKKHRIIRQTGPSPYPKGIEQEKHV